VIFGIVILLNREKSLRKFPEISNITLGKNETKSNKKDVNYIKVIHPISE